jgi:hypothetical protein
MIGIDNPTIASIVRNGRLRRFLKAKPHRLDCEDGVIPVSLGGRPLTTARIAVDG